MKNLIIFILIVLLAISHFQRERWEHATACIGDWVQGVLRKKDVEDSFDASSPALHTDSVPAEPDDMTYQALQRLAKLYDQPQ